MAHAPERTASLHRAALLTWILVGVVVLLAAGAFVLGQVRLAVVPLVLALFPATALSPVCDRLKRRVPPAVAAGVVVGGFVVALAATVALVGWLVADEVPAVVDALEEAYGDAEGFLADRFDVTIPPADEAIDRVGEWARGSEAGAAGRSLAVSAVEGVSGVLLALVALFFYLKDRRTIFRFLVQLAPPRARCDVAVVGRRTWETLGGYFRGQLLVAAVDAVFIGLGLALLGVPLALPLAVLVLFGGLFPIVGAFAAGAVAVLVALADAGLPTALAVLALNLVVQQVEGNLLEPLVVGRATRLHPLVVLASLTTGGVVLGVIGAFLAVPLTACVVRAVGYVLEQRRGEAPAAASPAVG